MNRPPDGRIFAYEPMVLKQLVLPNHYGISTKLIAGCLSTGECVTFRYTKFLASHFMDRRKRFHGSARAISWIGASDNLLARMWISASSREREARAIACLKCDGLKTAMA